MYVLLMEHSGAKLRLPFDERRVAERAMMALEESDDPPTVEIETVNEPTAVRVNVTLPVKVRLVTNLTISTNSEEIDELGDDFQEKVREAVRQRCEGKKDFADYVLSRLSEDRIFDPEIDDLAVNDAWEARPY